MGEGIIKAFPKIAMYSIQTKNVKEFLLGNCKSS